MSLRASCATWWPYSEVIAGQDLVSLSAAVHAANAMLYPLTWQHIFLPLMPASFVDYLTAPMVRRCRLNTSG